MLQGDVENEKRKTTSMSKRRKGLNVSRAFLSLVITQIVTRKEFIDKINRALITLISV